jgi:hypothetical protein
MVDVPEGVGVDGDVGVVMLLAGMSRPEPQPVAATKPHKTIRQRRRERYPRRCLTPKRPNDSGRIKATQIVRRRDRDAVGVTPVATVTVITTVPVPRFTGLAGMITQVEFAGMPLHVKVAEPGTPMSEVSRSE